MKAGCAFQACGVRACDHVSFFHRLSYHINPSGPSPTAVDGDGRYAIVPIWVEVFGVLLVHLLIEPGGLYICPLSYSHAFEPSYLESMRLRRRELHNPIIRQALPPQDRLCRGYRPPPAQTMHRPRCSSHRARRRPSCRGVQAPENQVQIESDFIFSGLTF